MAPSILTRKRDLTYLLFFFIHIPVVLLVDTKAIAPPTLHPPISNALNSYLINSYHDLNFVSPQPWFAFFIWGEVFFHLPISAWSIYGLLTDHPQVPLVLLVYGFETVFTTAVCIFDFLQWTAVDWDAKVGLLTIYGPYLLVSLFMFVDAYLRLSSALGELAKTRKVAAKKNL